MKKTKIIVPALGMLLLSTAASVTGTVAWFAVNTSVTVTGLQVKAKAEGGIVIAPYSITQSGVNQVAGPNQKVAYAEVAPVASAFKNTAANSLGVAELYPTSTSTATAWYHATSNDVNNHAASSAYATLSLTTDGKTYSGDGTSAETPWAINGQYYLYNKYVVKSTTEADSFGLYIRSMTVSADTNTEELNKSLRVAMKAGTGDVQFFAPKYDAAPAGGLKWYNGSAVAASTATVGTAYYGNTSRLTASDSEVVKNGIDLQIWVYYEGEDTNCTTFNADKVTVDTLSLEFSFATTPAVNP